MSNRCVHLTYAFRLLPTKHQHAVLARILEDQRQLYNAALPANLQRWTLRRLDCAYKAFFGRVKQGVTAGFPRSRGKGWRVAVQCSVPVSDPRVCQTSVGLDVGLEKLAALSDGTLIPSLRAGRKAARKIRILSRSMDRKVKGSKTRRKARASLAKAHEKIANTRATYLHQVSAALVKKYDLIAVEKLNIKGMSSGMFAKSVNDASWSKLLHNIRYKAENAGGRMIEVDARHTSQTCPGCGNINKKTLRERVHSCECGCVMDRDVAAAQIILRRAEVSPGLLNVGAVRPCVQAEISSIGEILSRS